MHTGPVVIADGGEMFGETANVAARVQGAAAPDTVAVTAATQRLVPGILVLEDRGPQALKWRPRRPVFRHPLRQLLQLLAPQSPAPEIIEVLVARADGVPLLCQIAR